MTVTTHSTTILRAPWLNLARALWFLLVAVILVITLAFIPVRLEQFAALCQQDAQFFPSPALVNVCVYYRLSVAVLLLVSCLVISGIGLLRRSDDWLVLFSILMVIATAAVFGFMDALVIVPTAWYVPTFFIRVLSPLMLYIFLYIFPDGRVAPRTMLPALVVTIIFVLSWILFPASPFNPYNLDTWPFSISLVLLGLVAGVSAQLYRYLRILNPIQKQQTKWILIGTFATAPAFLIVFLPFGIFLSVREPGLPRLLYTLIAEPTFQITYIFTLVCTAIAMLRYHLWEVDLIIRRTVTYALVTALLLLVYFASVIVLQKIFSQLTLVPQNDVVRVLSTLAIAALFVPLRNRVQNAIDKRFYRKKYDAQQVLQKFGETVRDETDLEKLTSELVRVVQETMQPTKVSVWLKKEERGK